MLSCKSCEARECDVFIPAFQHRRRSWLTQTSVLCTTNTVLKACPGRRIRVEVLHRLCGTPGTNFSLMSGSERSISITLSSLLSQQLMSLLHLIEIRHSFFCWTFVHAFPLPYITVLTYVRSIISETELYNIHTSFFFPTNNIRGISQ